MRKIYEKTTLAKTRKESYILTTKKTSQVFETYEVSQEQPMNWLAQIESEFRRIQPNDNPGRTRTIARRIAGIALKEYYHAAADDFIQLLKQAKDDQTLSDAVRSASDRLSTRLDANFNSPSLDPIGDAKIIVEFVKKR